MQSKYNRSQPVESKLAWFRCREEWMSVSKICELSGMSRKTYYKWRKRYGEEGREGLSERRRLFHNEQRLRAGGEAFSSQYAFLKISRATS